MSLEPTLIALDCKDLERSVDPYLDGEFDAPERAEVDAHLAGCPACRALVERQALVRASIRTKLREAMGTPEGHAPQALRARIEESLARSRRPLWRRLLAPVPIATLAACAAGALLVVLTHTGGDDPLVEDAVRKHHLALPLEVTSDVPAWFKGKLEFNPAPPPFKAAGITMMGGRLSHLREWPAAYIRYQLPRGQAGLFIVDDPEGRFDASGREIKVGPHTIRLVNARGYNVAVWREDEIVYSLVSDLDEHALFQLVETAQAAVAGR
jgi:anti-sigma factor RsiW